MQQRTAPYRRLRAALAVIVLTAGFATLFYLAGEVLRQVQRLNTADSDNIQWTLSQVEVEFFQMLADMEHAQLTGAELGDLRVSFDVYYSRIETIASGTLFAGFREGPDRTAALDASRRFLQAALPVIDGPDADLRAALPWLEAEALALAPEVRRLSLSGLGYFAAQADARRDSMKQTLTWLAVATAALLSALLVVAVRMARLFRISEGHAAEQRLTGARLATIIDTSLDGVLVTDAYGTIVEFNRAAERIFGHTRAAVLGRNVADVLVPERHRAAHAADMQAFRDAGRVPPGAERRVLEAARADGTVIPVEVAVQAAEGSDGAMLVASVRDISRRLAAERELVAARDRALAGERTKAQFLTQMSHEIRTPLNGLLGTLALMRDTNLSERQERYVQTMQSSGNILLGHVTDVLDVSRFEAGWPAPSRQPTDLAQVVVEVLDNQRALAMAVDDRLEWRWIGAPVDPVLTDAHRVRQILMNLVGNAVKFTRGGEVTVTLEAVARGEGTATVEIAVRDAGVGISPQDLGRVFRDFESGGDPAKDGARGTGLGLGIVRRLAGAMGGTVTARSVPGEGSEFRVRLPFALADRPATQGAPEAPLPAPPPRSVLVVEDNAVNRDVVREMLLADGHEVTEAADGVAGRDAAANRRFDLILMDIAMPGMDGRTAARAIRDLPGGSCASPIVALTAHDPPPQAADWRADGIDGWLCKPVDRARLRRVLAGELPGPAATGGPAPEHRVLDHERLMALDRELGTATAEKLLQRFVDDGEASLARVRALVAGPGHDEEIRAELHRLSGSAAMFGAVGLEAFLRGRLSPPEGAAAAPDPSLAEALQEVWSSLRAELAAGRTGQADRAAS